MKTEEQPIKLSILTPISGCKEMPSKRVKSSHSALFSVLHLLSATFPFLFLKLNAKLFVIILRFLLQNRSHQLKGHNSVSWLPFGFFSHYHFIYTASISPGCTFPIMWLSFFFNTQYYPSRHADRLPYIFYHKIMPIRVEVPWYYFITISNCHNL